MMNNAIEAVRADRAALLDMCGALTPAEWQAESGCEGWSVQDLISHLGATFWAMVDPTRLPDTTGMPFERAQDAVVHARRAMSPDTVAADYAEASELGLAQLPEIAALDLEIPLGDAGNYAAALVPSAFSFDHYTHIRADLFGPRGPLAGPPPASDELRLAPALDWIEAALPQQNPAAAEAASYELHINGRCSRIITFGTGQATATVSSDAESFIRWVTQRASWEDLGVQAAGDEPALSAASKLRVF
jgi:uncharacterized protein (TIGR03083 family)